MDLNCILSKIFIKYYNFAHLKRRLIGKFLIVLNVWIF